MINPFLLKNETNKTQVDIHLSAKEYVKLGIVFTVALLLVEGIIHQPLILIGLAVLILLCFLMVDKKRKEELRAHNIQMQSLNNLHDDILLSLYGLLRTYGHLGLKVPNEQSLIYSGNNRMMCDGVSLFRYIVLLDSSFNMHPETLRRLLNQRLAEEPDMPIYILRMRRRNDSLETVVVFCDTVESRKYIQDYEKKRHTNMTTAPVNSNDEDF